jgi:aryl-alcohol dehydrogenase-like predicted oxidoreductase
MNQRTLGRTGPVVSALGLGAMGMSDFYGPADRDESIATIHAALGAGVTLLDTGDFYGMGHNELLIAEALRGHKREDVLLSVKFGAQRDPAGNWIGYAASPPAVKTALAYTLRRLNTEYVDIYRPARLDASVPIEETIGAIGELVQAGYVRHVGLSEVGAETIRRAAAVHPIADLQIEYSLVSRGIEDAILPACRELGIGITAYGVLSRGLISGHWTKERSAAERGFRAHGPRFLGENLDRNLALVEALRAIADAKGYSVAQIAIAWVLARGEDIVPVVGARRRDRLQEALGALDVRLDADDMAQIERAVPPDAAAGSRYAEAQMQHLDSERDAAPERA